jgi:multidrug efflux pump subunit AcrA (membrane-fusion protein)
MLSFIKRRKIAIIIAIVLVIIAIFAFRARTGNGHETVVVLRGELIRTVELAGKVTPMEEVDLSFEVGGTVARAYKKVGDKISAGETIAELDRSSTNADLLKAEADLLAARAELARRRAGAPGKGY